MRKVKNIHTFATAFAKIAQLVEHDLAKVGVAGSSPVFRSDRKMILTFKTGREVYPDLYREVPFFAQKKKSTKRRSFVIFLPEFAQMVKLVDTLVSGTSGRKAVQVRVLFWAHIIKKKRRW